MEFNDAIDWRRFRIHRQLERRIVKQEAAKYRVEQLQINDAPVGTGGVNLSLVSTQ